MGSFEVRYSPEAGLPLAPVHGIPWELPIGAGCCPGQELFFWGWSAPCTGDKNLMGLGLWLVLGEMMPLATCWPINRGQTGAVAPFSPSLYSNPGHAALI